MVGSLIIHYETKIELLYLKVNMFIFYLYLKKNSHIRLCEKRRQLFINPLWSTSHPWNMTFDSKKYK